MRRPVLTFLPLGLFLLAIAEIAVFVGVVHWVGAFWAMVTLAATSIAGLLLLRREGIRGWRAFRSAAEEGRPPGEQVTNSLVGLLGALLLAVPGFISSIAGLLLVLPPFRALARHGVRRLTERYVSTAVAGDFFGPRHVRVRQGDPTDSPSTPPPSSPAGVIEGEVIR
ncbi:FxsA family protein [Actinoplanes sp. NPDC049265]|uniref:FxsA family protein n=1 Tax=Actinoplanes sp. NPDC049265 TaxID=3363902 RepID=UPI00371A2394